jgi:hypothetical protein
MPFTRAEMLYDKESYYKWSARADHDNPYYRGGTDAAELNRTEGYEILYFINHVGNRLSRTRVEDYRKMERLIRYSVPGNIRSRNAIEQWIKSNW